VLPDNEGGRMPDTNTQMDADCVYEEQHKEMVCHECKGINENC
jgi:hypothetical protein